MSHAGMTAEVAESYKRTVAEMPSAKRSFTLDNPLLDTDSYKVSHARQYPPGTTHLYSYIESRGGEFDRVMFFGLQAFLKRYISSPITTFHVQEASDFFEAHGVPFERHRWDHIVERHGGRLPVEIRALPEGIVVPVNTVLLTIVNTDPSCFWLVSWLETALLRAIWYPSTVATISRECKSIIRHAFDRTSDEPAGLPYKLHDFGARGVSSLESASLGGMAHLVNFRGSDTISGVLAANEWYDEPMAGTSIPAAEHSTITSWGIENEAAAYRNMLDQFGSGPVVAVVSDSYDIYHAVSQLWGGELRDKVLDIAGTLVIRPDSGDPTTVPVEVISMLDRAFGHTVNSKGYKVLHPKVRVIQGDGITFGTMRSLIWTLTEAGHYAIDNLSFGMGGGLLQHCDRDTMKFAMKCSAAKINGEWRDVSKAPVGDLGKASKRGRFAVVHVGEGRFETVDIKDRLVKAGVMTDWLQMVWRDGELLRHHTFSAIRATADRYL